MSDKFAYSQPGLLTKPTQPPTAAPRVPSHEERILELEARVQQLCNELHAVAESHAGRLASLEERVGG